MGIKDFFKNMLGERLDKPFLEPDRNPDKDLSTTRDPNDLVANIAVTSADQYYELFKPRAADQYIPLWRDMSNKHIEIQEALEEIINDAIVVDDTKDIFDIDFKKNISDDVPDKMKEKITKEWKYLYNVMNLDENAEIHFKRFYVDAVLIGEVIFSNKQMKSKGVQRVDLLEPIGMNKQFSRKIGKDVYFKDSDDGNKHLNFMFQDNASDKYWLEDQIATTNSGLYESRYKIYLSYLNYAVRPLNQLNAIENSLIVYALTRSTERLVFYVDVGEMPEKKALAKIEEIARRNSTNQQYDQSTGQVINTRDKIKLSKEIYLGTRNGERGTRIEDISATSMNINDMPILDYFLDRVYRSLKVPRLRRNKDATFQFGETQEIEREEINFFKFIIKLRQRFSHFYKDVLKKHLISKGIINEEEWNITYRRAIKFMFNNNNDYNEIMRITALRSRLEILSTINEFTVKDENGELVIFSKEYVMKEILNLTEDQIKELNKQVKQELSKTKVKTQEIDDIENQETNEEDEDFDDNEENIEFKDLINEYEKENKDSFKDDDMKVSGTFTELELLKETARDGDLIIDPKSKKKFVYEINPETNKGELKPIEE